MLAEHVSFEGASKSGTELETLLELGQGGMATAYLARAVGTAGFQRLVVLKRMNLELLGNRDALDRFMAEARIAARIHHANVVGTQQVGRDAAGPFIVLDYVEGGSIDDLLAASAERDERLPVPVLLRIALDALAGLDAVHSTEDADGRSLSILHRDVSLQNILVGVHDGVSRLSDFGVAKSTLGMNRTHPSYLVGKLCYLAPEYLRRETCGPSLDTYALGVTLWMALTGQDLWPNATEGQVVRAILDDGVPRLEGYVQVAPEIADLVARACHTDARQRFRSAREMADAVETFGRECGWVASHAEVAALVRELLGERLRLRREMLAGLAGGARSSRAWSAVESALRSTTPDRHRKANGAAPSGPHGDEITALAGPSAMGRGDRPENPVLEPRLGRLAAFVNPRLRSWLRRHWKAKTVVPVVLGVVALVVLVASFWLAPARHESRAPEPHGTTDVVLLPPPVPVLEPTATRSDAVSQAPERDTAPPVAGPANAGDSSSRPAPVAQPRASSRGVAREPPKPGPFAAEQIQKRNPYR